MLNWLRCVALPFALVAACNVLYPSIIASAEHGQWVLLVGMSTGQALLAGWAGWRVIRRRAGDWWAAAWAGGATQLAPFILIGVALAKGAPAPSGSQVGGFVLLAGIATTLRFAGATLASIQGRRRET